MIDVVSRRRSNPSPLRYPGGKASLADFFEETIKELGLDRPTYVEPFAGGAGAGLELLYRGVVRKVVINDYDRSIYSIWKSMLSADDAFLRLLNDTPVTVDEWLKQREVYRRRDDADLSELELGFATFFLNRTNRSGVLQGGMIGGLKQAGDYKLDARYNKKTLLSRIQKLREYRSRILVTNFDGATRLRYWLDKSDQEVFAYVDPPYYDKGSLLYLNAFNDRQHAELATLLNEKANTNWVLTYDMAPYIERLYSGRTSLKFNLHYSAHRRELARELMVLSDPVATALSERD